MLVVTYSEARRTFASILDKAKEDGAVIIRRADGSMFRLSPEPGASSPFDGVETEIRLKRGELKKALDEGKDYKREKNRANRKPRS